MIQTESMMYYRPVNEPSGDASWGCDCNVELEDVSHIGDQSGQDVGFARPCASEHRSKKLCPGVQCLDAMVECGFCVGLRLASIIFRSALGRGQRSLSSAALSSLSSSSSLSTL